MLLEGWLTIARDSAITLLAIEAFVVSLIVLLVLIMVTRLLRKLRRRFVPTIRIVGAKFTVAMHIVQRIMEAICAPIIWAHSAFAGIRAGASGVRRILLGGRR